MNRKPMPWVIGLLVLLLPACLCPGSGGLPSGALATASALAPTLFAAVGQTATAAAAVGNKPTGTAASVPAAASNTPIPALTDTPAPTSTQGPTETPALTETPTEAPPLAPIADACKLLDTKLVSTLIGQPIAKTQNTATPGSWTVCYALNSDASGGATVSIAQDKVAADLHVRGYAMINAAKACATPMPVSAAVLKKEQDTFAKLGLTGNRLVREAYTRGYVLIGDKGCTDKYAVQAIPGLGDAAYADHIWGYEEMGAVYRNTVVYVSVYFKGITSAQAVDIEQKLLPPVVAALQTK